MQTAGFVQSCQFLPQNSQRPAIADDVVRIQNQNMICVAKLQQQGAQERAGLQIKGSLYLPCSQAAGVVFSLCLGHCGQVGEHERDGKLGRHDLRRLILNGVKGRSQRLVATNDLL